MYCSVCKRETTPIKIGADFYCSTCGTAYAKPSGSGATPVTPKAAAKPGTIDLRPAAPAPKPPAPATAPAPAPKAAAAVTHDPNHTALRGPGGDTNQRHIAQFTDRFERARKFGRSAQISRFGADRMGNIQDPAKMYDKFGNPTAHTLTHQSSALAKRDLPKLATTQHEAMAKLPRSAAPAAPTARAAHAPTPRLTPAAGRTLAFAAAVAIMGGYIWLQNYPKLAIQNAGDRAGLSASMPSYVPSSYSLEGTSTGPGLVTLRFASPSADEILKISQHRTTWDSSSLVDNYIAKSADDYAAVQGQGLTIYFWGQNQAAWVNHGVWYSIEGATRLSREQILKIAYSL